MRQEQAVSTIAEAPVEEVRQPVVRSYRRRVVAVGLAAFTSGAVLLGLEITASRVVAPFFGNSLFVWGALIGVVLTGLALGYAAGGALGDQMPAPQLLAGVMGLGGALVALIPLVDEPLLEAVVRWNPGPRLNPLLAAIALFGPPSIVFAAVTPITVRLLARSIASVGRTAGRLFAVSTAGSIFGTFATAFYLVPEFGTDQLLILFSAAMFAAVAVVAIVERMPVVVAAGLAAAVAAGVGSAAVAPEAGGTLTGVAAQNWSPVYRSRGGGGETTDFKAEGFKVAFQKDTQYHRLAVVDGQDSRYLRFDNSFQSGMYLRRPFATRFQYTDYLQLGFAYNPDARDVLFVGLGGGSAQKTAWRTFPRLRMEVAELDPVVRDVAYRYFALPRSPRLKVDVEDGRRYLDTHDRRWDVIVLDAYFSDSVPFHLTTEEFLQLAHSRLKPGGVVVANVIGALRGPNSKLFRSFYRTYRTVFPTVLVHPVRLSGERDDETRNLIFVATDTPAQDEVLLHARWKEIRDRAPAAPDLRKAIADRYDSFVPTGDVPTLTDDYAPTDALLFVD